MMQSSVENNKCTAHIIPVTSKCAVSISPWSVSAYHSAKEPLPHTHCDCLMMLPGS